MGDERVDGGFLSCGRNLESYSLKQPRSLPPLRAPSHVPAVQVARSARCHSLTTMYAPVSFINIGAYRNCAPLSPPSPSPSRPSHSPSAVGRTITALSPVGHGVARTGARRLGACIRSRCSHPLRWVVRAHALSKVGDELAAGRGVGAGRAAVRAAEGALEPCGVHRARASDVRFG